MSRLTLFVILAFALSLRAAPPQITIYNSGFALVRQSMPLDLKAGENHVHCTDVTTQVDSGSVTLRDPAGKTEFIILEQKFSSQALTKEAMLARFEGQTIPFRMSEGASTKIANGKIYRARPKGVEPIIEMENQYLFELPGAPLFPSLPDDAVLRPELNWKLSAKNAAKIDAELVFLTGGLNWEADYNAVTTENGNISDFNGWVTIKNGAGARFENARIKVVAGDINRAVETGAVAGYSAGESEERHMIESSPAVAQPRSLDEYHEYVLPNAVTLRDGETTQVELIRARDIKSRRSFVYDGSYFNPASIRANSAILDPEWGTQSNTKVATVYEFKNDAEHHLGGPLPAGRMHFYRLDEDGQLQFAGDATIDNTAPNEELKLTPGNAFDLAAERKQTQFQINDPERSVVESFEIKLRNHRKSAAEIRVREHPSRWREWEITAQSIPAKKIDQHTIEFVVPIAPEEEKVVTYSIRYKKLPIRRVQAEPATSQ